MKYRMLTLAILLISSSAAQAQQPAKDVVLTTYLRRSYAAVSRNILAAVETMPEQDLRFRPVGVIDKVRTFGEIVAHLTSVNSWICTMGDGKPASKTAIDSTLAIDKARLVALLNETNARCTAYLETLTDTALTQIITSGSPPRALQAVRGNSIIFAIATSNAHYGNLVTYLRAKGLVPPAVAAQAVFLSPVAVPTP